MIGWYPLAFLRKTSVMPIKSHDGKHPVTQPQYEFIARYSEF